MFSKYPNLVNFNLKFAKMYYHFRKMDSSLFGLCSKKI
jgi:hypothetical protein